MSRDEVMKPMFTVRMGLKGDDPRDIHYVSFVSFWDDTDGLTELFCQGLVESCQLYCGGVRLGGLGRLRLVDLRDLIISNSSRILRGYCGAG